MDESSNRFVQYTVHRHTVAFVRQVEVLLLFETREQIGHLFRLRSRPPWSPPGCSPPLPAGADSPRSPPPPPHLHNHRYLHLYQCSGSVTS